MLTNSMAQEILGDQFIVKRGDNWQRFDPDVSEYTDLTDAEILTIEKSPLADPRLKWRETASIPRAAFILAIAGVGILPKAEAIEAAKGNWPQTFNTAIASLSDADKFGAEVAWATATDISRNHPLIAILAASAELDDAQVDALFGYVAA